MNKTIKIILVLCCLGIISFVYINMDRQTTNYIKVIDNILDESIDGIAVSISDIGSMSNDKSLLLDIETNMVDGKLKSWDHDGSLSGLSIEILKELVTLEDGYSNFMLSDKDFYMLEVNVDFTKGTNTGDPHSMTLYIDKETRDIVIPQIYDVEDKYNVSISNQHTFEASEKLYELVDSLLDGLKIEASEPSYTLDQNYGVTMVFLEYASDELVVFRGTFGLFVYSLIDKAIIRSVDLVEIGCEMVQGSEAAMISVDSEGKLIYVYKANSDGMYIYDIDLNKFTPSIYKPLEDSVHLYDSFEELEHANGLISANCVKFDHGEYGYLESDDYTVRTLKYVRGEKVYDIFN